MTIPSGTSLASAETRLAGTSSAPSEKARRTVLEMLAPLGVPIMTLGMIVYFGFATKGFLSIGNITDVFANSALPVIVAVGLTIPLVMGEFDLSISALAGLATVLYAQLVAKEGVNPATAILVTLVASLAAGAFNGFMIAYIGLPALVATIAMSSFLVGMQFYVSGSVQIYGGFPETLVAFSRSNIGPVPTLVIVAATIVIGAWVLLEKSVFGRRRQSGWR